MESKSASLKSVYEKLLNIQANVNVPKNRTAQNSNNSKVIYTYRNCEDIMEGVKPFLVDERATLILKDEVVQVGDRYYIKATALFIDIDTGDTIEASAYAREEVSGKMSASQLTGASSSYARKYALCGLFDLDDSNDADSLQEVLNQPQAQYKQTQYKQAQYKQAQPQPQAQQPQFKPLSKQTKIRLGSIEDSFFSRMVSQYNLNVNNLSEDDGQLLLNEWGAYLAKLQSN